jgi:hypothetical protein
VRHTAANRYRVLCKKYVLYDHDGNVIIIPDEMDHLRGNMFNFGT